MKKMKNKAFTIGETIVAMLIVGVVAVMTIPLLNNSFRRNAMQAGFVDSVKSINSALYNYSTRMSCNGRLACTDLFTAGANTAEKLSTIFKSASAGVDCWAGKTITGGNTDLSGFGCFTDGSEKIFAFQNFGNSCTTNLGTENDAGKTPPKKLSRSCGYVYFDVNGVKGPNRFGYDIFIFAITDNPQTYLYPVGGEFWQDTTNNFNGVQSCTVNGEGRTCAGKIVKDGMKIKYFK